MQLSEAEASERSIAAPRPPGVPTSSLAGPGPVLKWPGGKSQELAAIAASAPFLTGRFIDPFVGGGSVLLAVPDGVEAWANDAAEDLMRLYRAASEERWSFRATVHGVAAAWEKLRSFDEFYRALGDDFLSGSSARQPLGPTCEPAPSRRLWCSRVLGSTRYSRCVSPRTFLRSLIACGRSRRPSADV